MTSEVVGIFSGKKDRDSTIAELDMHFPRHDISVLADRRKIEEKFGPGFLPAEIMEDNPSAPRAISLRLEEKTIGGAAIIGACAYVGGTMAAVIYGTISTASLVISIALGSLIGGMAGTAILLAITGKIKRSVEDQLKQGGLLVWVKVPDGEKEQTAAGIMRKYGGHHIHVHQV